MPSSDIYTELKTWQTGIGATLGFVALLAGALFNFHLNRKRDAAIRQGEVLAVATALYGEITLLREEAARLARIVAAKRIGGTEDEINDQFAADYMPVPPTLYMALADKLGILPASLVLAITRFHHDYRQTRDGLALLVDKGRGFTFNMSTVLRPACNAVEKVKPALRAIEAMAGIKVAAPDPDLGYATDILEMEEAAAAAFSG